MCWGDWSKGVVIARWVGFDQSNDVGGGWIIVTFVTYLVTGLLSTCARQKSKFFLDSVCVSHVVTC